MGGQDRSREEILLDIIRTESELHTIQDVDILLEQILTDARKVVNADAGSIYVVEDNKLSIRYAQNDTFVKKLNPGEKLPFTRFSFPIDQKTIAGYVASTKQLVNEPDVYNIANKKAYRFGIHADEASGYRTVSNLTMPLVNSAGSVLGVIQVLNSKNIHGEVVPFTLDDELYLSHFASNATVALEKAFLTRAMILRMIRMSELRDPSETAGHINRVANYAVEIYDRWAFVNDVPIEARNKYRDSLKIAAMLHDVGKVAISDAILKKPGRLDDSEFAIMKSHTWLGARLFEPKNSEVDKLSSDIAFSHHESWDGSGYPGKIDLKTGEPLEINPKTGKVQGLVQYEIPLGARIVAVADVYDALSCKRVYKEAWTEEQTLDELQKMSGVKFDPEMISAFLHVFHRIKSIKDSYSG